MKLAAKDRSDYFVLDNFGNFINEQNAACGRHSNDNYYNITVGNVDAAFLKSKLFGCCKTDTLFGFYLVFYVMYLCFGAAMFSVLETPTETEIVVNLLTARSQFLIKHPNVSENDLDDFVSDVIGASSRGVTLHNGSNEANWSFGQSLFFSGTVVTTIGYGHVTPLSRAGKAFCIVYAIFGIPFTLVLLSAFVERILVPFSWFLEFLNIKLGHLYQPFKIRILHLLIMATLVLTVFMLIPAAVFTYLEPDWNYLDSIYYCFISLTTIGLGDYIPGDAPNQPFRALYKILTTAYLIVGITFIMATLAVFYDIPQLNMSLLFSSASTTSSTGGGPDSERLHLVSSFDQHPKYSDPQLKVDSQDMLAGPGHKQVFRVRSRQPDDSSPDEP